MSRSSREGSRRSRRNKRRGLRQDRVPTPRPLTMDQLRSGLSTLPLELRDMVFDLVFAISPDTTRYIGKLCYKPPVQLQISRKTRADFAEKFYNAQASWIFLCDWHSKPNPDTIGRWWASLDEESKLLMCRPRREVLSSGILLDASDTVSGRVHRYPTRAPITIWLNFWYRWVVGGKMGIGNLYEVLQFLPPSDKYDGISEVQP